MSMLRKVSITLVSIFSLWAYVFNAQANNDNTRIFACNDFPPQKIEDPIDGLPGYDVEILIFALTRMGYDNKIEYHAWKRAKRKAENGTVDGLCSCSYRPEREEHFLFTDAIGYASTGIYTKAGYAGPAINSLRDLKGQLVGVIAGYNLETELQVQDIEMSSVNKERNAIKMIEADRFDYFYSYRSTTDFILSRQNKQGSLTYHPIDTSPYYICISRKSKNADQLLTQFNTALKEMRSDHTIKSIMAKYR